MPKIDKVLWRYWSDYYSPHDAVQYQFQELKEDPIIAAAVAQIQVAEMAIEARVAEIGEENPEEEP